MRRQFGLILDDCHCVNLIASTRQGRPHIRLFVIIGPYLIQNRHGKVANVISAIDKSIYNNHNDK